MLRWLNLLLVLVTLLCYVTPLINPQYVWPVAILGLFCPWLILANVLAAMLWAVLRKRQFWVNLACVALGWAYIGSLFNVPHAVAAPADSDLQLRVMSYNCRNFIPVGQADKVDPAIIATYLAGQAPDLLCIQEYPSLQRDAMAYQKAIGEATLLPYFYQDPAGQLAIFSRYPFGKKGSKFYGNRANGYLFTELDTDFGKLRLYNIHLQSNAITGMADAVADHGNLQERDTWLTIKGMLGRYGRAARVRTTQAQEIADHLSRSPYPVILCGDFNDVPVSYVYRTFRAHLDDAFTHQGSGFGTTYAGSLPGLRIDYILPAAPFTVHQFTTLPARYSDHRAVVGELSFSRSLEQ